MSTKKHYKNKADFDNAVAEFKAEHRQMKATIKSLERDREEVMSGYEKQVDVCTEENRRLHKWIKELKAEIKALKEAPGTGLYLAKSTTFEVYIAADSFAAAEKAFTARHEGNALESLEKLADNFLNE